MKKYVIDGKDFNTLEDFFNVVSRVLLIDSEWGKNLDAFNDILRGGYRTPKEGFILEWKNSDFSRKRLGYAETIRQLEKRAQRTRVNVSEISKRLDLAKKNEGSTIFDELIEIIQNHGSGGEEAEDCIELILN